MRYSGNALVSTLDKRTRSSSPDWLVIQYRLSTDSSSYPLKGFGRGQMNILVNFRVCVSINKFTVTGDTWSFIDIFVEFPWSYLILSLISCLISFVVSSTCFTLSFGSFLFLPAYIVLGRPYFNVCSKLQTKTSASFTVKQTFSSHIIQRIISWCP